MFKKIKGYENYSVDTFGNVINTKSSKLKVPSNNYAGKGYLYVDLWKNGKRKRLYIHRLVAETFIPKEENKPYVNHKDGNSQNNYYKNLEWCSPLENVEHAVKYLGIMQAYKIANEKRKKKVKQINYLSGETVAIHTSIREAERKTGIPSSNITACLKGRQKYTKEYSWCYVETI